MGKISQVSLMAFKPLFFLLFLAFFVSCKETHLQVTHIEGKQIPISDSLSADNAIEDFIKPYRIHIQKDLDSVLAYSTATYSKTDGDFNTAIGNLMADAVFDAAYPIFKSRTGKAIDMVLLNHGGIRSIISKGPITTRTAFELMPFENSLLVVALNGSQIDSLLAYLCASKKAHPISKLHLAVDMDFKILEATIDGKNIEDHKIYYVATSDYLYNGGDNMTFFKRNDGVYDLNYKIRNGLIDYFKKVDTIRPMRDNRFVQKTLEINP